MPWMLAFLKNAIHFSPLVWSLMAHGGCFCEWCQHLLADNDDKELNACDVCAIFSLAYISFPRQVPSCLCLWAQECSPRVSELRKPLSSLFSVSCVLAYTCTEAQLCNSLFWEWGGRVDSNSRIFHKCWNWLGWSNAWFVIFREIPEFVSLGRSFLSFRQWLCGVRPSGWEVKS